MSQIKRLQVRLRKISRSIKAEKTVKLNEIQQNAINIMRKSIIKPDATLLIDPVKAINYVEYKHIFIKFSHTSATITNGKYSYYVEFDYKTGDDIIAFFNRHVEKRRDVLEGQYMANTIKSLQEIYKEVC